MSATHIFSVFMALGVSTILLVLLLLPLEATGVLGRIPTRLNNFLTVLAPVCIAIGMIAYWLK